MHNQVNHLSVIELDRVLSLNNINSSTIPLEFKLNYIEVIGEHKMTKGNLILAERNIADLRHQMENENGRYARFENTMNEFRERQTAFSQRQNIFDLRLNTQDNKILFLSQQIESIKNEMSRFGQQAARSINPNEIIPEPYPGEEEFLKGIVAGKLPELEMIFLTNSSIYLKSLK